MIFSLVGNEYLKKIEVIAIYDFQHLNGENC